LRGPPVSRTRRSRKRSARFPASSTGSSSWPSSRAFGSSTTRRRPTRLLHGEALPPMPAGRFASFSVGRGKASRSTSSPKITLALVAFGLVMVYSATSAPAALERTDPMSYLKKQGVYALIGVVLMMSASRFDYRRLRLLAPALVLSALGGCLAVLVIGARINGARRWIELGPATFQPSELAKLALAVWAAAYLAKRPAPRTLRELWRPIGLLLGVF